MRTNNIVKRIGIASLCLGVAISAFSGISSFNKSISFSGEAEATTFQGTELVNTTATVTQDANGLRVSSDVGYQATFNRVFYGDTSFAFHFPERNSENTVEEYQSYITPHGDFTFRVTDATDESKFFEVQYYVSRTKNSKAADNWTGVILKYGEEIRTTSVKVGATSSAKQTWYNVKTTGIDQDDVKKNFLPSFLGTGSKGSTVGRLSFKWSADGVLSVNARAATYDNQDFPIAKFDGTYDATATKNGFVSKTSWGLPKISFPNGYKISFSSEFTTTKTTDQGTDVMFTSITNGKAYNFMTATEYANDNYAKANDKIKVETGKVLLGWKDADSKLYSTASVLTGATDLSSYDPVYVGFDTMNGASVRIESAEGGKSGIRFMTIFNVDDYAAVKDYITEFGTLITYTDTLNTLKKDFTIDNYTGEATFAQVVNKKGVFTYTDKSSNQYKAYSMALVDIQNYAKEYSARGYLEVTYADETTQIIYTDYNAENNSRSVAKVAHLLKTQDSAAYEAMTDARKAILDSYADAYVVPEE